MARGASSPEAGARAGRQAGTRFVADLAVTIADLRAFFHDPEHRAHLSGQVSCPGLASDRPISDGSLAMYVADREMRAKLMRYRITFPGDDGMVYELRGVKVLHTPFPSLRSQVTLHSEIYRVAPEPQRWGAGVLVFRLRDLPSFIASMRVEGARRVWALWHFGRFAHRELSRAVA